jgi:hypothetical protein
VDRPVAARSAAAMCDAKRIGILGRSLTKCQRAVCLTETPQTVKRRKCNARVLGGWQWSSRVASASWKIRPREPTASHRACPISRSRPDVNSLRPDPAHLGP